MLFFYVIEQNIRISKAGGNHTPYFRHLTENQLKKLSDLDSLNSTLLHLPISVIIHWTAI